MDMVSNSSQAVIPPTSTIFPPSFALPTDYNMPSANVFLKPPHSYIGLIAMAILSGEEQQMTLAEIYQWIENNYAYFRWRGATVAASGWRNSIRHNLSLNECFVKAGRASNGKGHYWQIHPANIDDFRRSDFRRKQAQWRLRSHYVLSRAIVSAARGECTEQFYPASEYVRIDTETSDSEKKERQKKKELDQSNSIFGLIPPNFKANFLVLNAGLPLFIFGALPKYPRRPSGVRRVPSGVRRGRCGICGIDGVCGDSGGRGRLRGLPGRLRGIDSRAHTMMSSQPSISLTTSPIYMHTSPMRPLGMAATLSGMHLLQGPIWKSYLEKKELKTGNKFDLNALFPTATESDSGKQQSYGELK
ncbi:forkhead domain-containing protein [Ditylenchus destructor]|uniref:Forkhead domain-containing protein n=1 Tax=Ditylenchus destructor TaxID=166010 RepID=A0AAD4MQ42_9BILA|nr:forkhead domain-containing protein [Ditylenchus destructor]